MDCRCRGYQCGITTSFPGGKHQHVDNPALGCNNAFSDYILKCYFLLKADWLPTENSQIWADTASLGFAMVLGWFEDATLLCSWWHLPCLFAGSLRGTSSHLSQKWPAACMAVWARWKIPTLSTLSRGRSALCLCHASHSLTRRDSDAPETDSSSLLFDAWIRFLDS